MIVGCKTGPYSWEADQPLFQEEQVPMCEVWYNPRKDAEYKTMFARLRDLHVRVGLHHWGLTSENILTNFRISFYQQANSLIPF